MNLNETSNINDMENFLLFHIDNADERRSKINPSLTKKQVWDINMVSVLRGQESIRVHKIIRKNITKEFGSYYE